MPEIKNPRHSRPIDVHRWSDHPEVKELVDRIWDGFLGEVISEANVPHTIALVSLI